MTDANGVTEIPELREQWEEVNRQDERRQRVIARIETLAERQAKERRRLMEATSETARAEVVTALTPLLIEATVLPDEAVLVADEYALAIHQWARLALDVVESIEGEARAAVKAIHSKEHDERESIANADAIEAADRHMERPTGSMKKPTTLTALAVRSAAATAELNKQAREKTGPLLRLISERCRRVFGPSGKDIGEIKDGKLTGHEAWLARVRQQAEAPLRAESQR